MVERSENANGERRWAPALDELDQRVQIIRPVARDTDRERFRKAGVDQLAPPPSEHVGRCSLASLLYPHASLVPAAAPFLPASRPA